MSDKRRPWIALAESILVQMVDRQRRAMAMDQGDDEVATTGGHPQSSQPRADALAQWEVAISRIPISKEAGTDDLAQGFEAYMEKRTLDEWARRAYARGAFTAAMSIQGAQTPADRLAALPHKEALIVAHQLPGPILVEFFMAEEAEEASHGTVLETLRSLWVEWVTTERPGLGDMYVTTGAGQRCMYCSMDGQDRGWDTVGRRNCPARAQDHIGAKTYRQIVAMHINISRDAQTAPSNTGIKTWHDYVIQLIRCQGRVHPFPYPGCDLAVVPLALARTPADVDRYVSQCRPGIWLGLTIVSSGAATGTGVPLIDWALSSLFFRATTPT
jgi:hypothetical protein